MNKPALTLAALAALRPVALAAPVSITSGSLTYTQSFDSLGPASVAWDNDSTIPGWDVQINNGSTANSNAQAADGSAILSGLLNLGSTGAPDRALGSKATGTGNLANIAYAVSFQNNTGKPVGLTQLQYAGELWRTNSGTGTPQTAVDEEYVVYYQVSSSAVTNIQSGATSPVPLPGAGFAALGAGANWINPVNIPLATATAGALDGNAAANRATVTFSPSRVILQPGQFLLLKWTDANESGTDGFQGIDDVVVAFVELNGALTPSVSDVTRAAGGTPANPADDTFGFTVNVAASGIGVGPGWTAATVTPPATNATGGLYGANVRWTGFPAAGPKGVTFTDNSNALYFAGISVDPPKVIGTNIPANENVITAGSLPAQWVIDETLQTLTMTNGGGAPAQTVTAAAVDLPAVSGAVRLSAVLGVRDTSSGFEAADTFLAQLILNDGVSDTTVNLVTSYDSDASGAMNGAELAPGGGTAAIPTVRSYVFSHNIPENIVSVRLVISGNNDSPNETMIVSEIRIDPAPPSLAVTAPSTIVRHENGPGLADDTVSFDVTITGTNGGASWNATGATPASGAFGPVRFAVPAVTSPAVVVVSDAGNAAVSQNLSIVIPARYTIGWHYDGTTLTDIFSDVATVPAAEWVNDPVLHTLDMSAGGPSDKIVASDVLNLTATGTVHFSAILRARETSVGSNFETGDRFKAELIIDGGIVPGNVINLVSAWDSGDGAAAVGAAGGPNGPPNGYINGYQGIAVAPETALLDYNANKVRDEFNTRAGGGIAETMINNSFALSAVIPAGANSVQLRIYGAGIASSEFFTVSQTVFSTVPPTADTDGDGITDLNEIVDGTDPHDATSLFHITEVAPHAGNPGSSLASFPTAAGRLYQGYYSSDLATWTRDSTTSAVAGDGGLHVWPLVPGPAPGVRRYLKILAGFSAADFPATLP